MMSDEIYTIACILTIINISMQQDDSLYEVEEIIGKSRIKNKVVYKVKWKGYPMEQCTWETQAHLCYVKDLVSLYEKQFKEHDSDGGMTTNLKDNPIEKDGQGECQIDVKDDRLERLKSRRFKDQEGSRIYELSGKQWQYCEIKDQFEIRSNIQMVPQQESEHNDTFIEQDPILEKQNQDMTSPLEKQNNNELTQNQGNQHEIKNIKERFRNQHRRNRHSRSSKRARKQAKITDKHNKFPEINIKTESTTKPTKQDDNDASISQEPKNNRSKRNITEETQLLNSSKGQLPSHENQPEIKIRILGDDLVKSNNDSRDYLVQYNIGTMKIMTTLELMMTHPLEFVDYLQKKALSK